MLAVLEQCFYFKPANRHLFLQKKAVSH